MSDPARLQAALDRLLNQPSINLADLQELEAAAKEQLLERKARAELLKQENDVAIRQLQAIVLSVAGVTRLMVR